MEEALSTVKYTEMPRELAEAAANLVLETIAALDEDNDSSNITESKQCKEIIMKLVIKIEAPEMKQILTNQMRLWKIYQRV